MPLTSNLKLNVFYVGFSSSLRGLPVNLKSGKQKNNPRFRRVRVPCFIRMGASYAYPASYWLSMVCRPVTVPKTHPAVYKVAYWGSLASTPYACKKQQSLKLVINEKSPNRLTG